MIAVERSPEEVFDPVSMASFEGAAVTLRHPSDAVGPGNWREHAVGHLANIRQGSPPDDDKLIGDLVLHDQRAIDLVRHGRWRGVSLGYDAEYVRTGPGRARQIDARPGTEAGRREEINAA